MKRRILLVAIAALLVARCGPDPGQRERADDGERSAAVVSEESDEAPTQSPPRSLEFTYPGHPHDALYRDLANAVFAFEARDFLRRGSECGDQPIDGPRAGRLRRQNALARTSQLMEVACAFDADEICENAAFSGERQCHSGEALLAPSVFFLSPDGEHMSGRVHLSVFGAGGRAGGDIIQVFEYDYFGVRTKPGWTVERRAFNGLQKL